MADFTIEIAAHTARIQSIFDSTRDYCRKYLSGKTPEMTIFVTREDLVFEQQALDEEAVEEGLRRRKFSDPFLERTAIQRKLAEYLLTKDVLLIHGSAVAVDGEGYLFTAAKCGTGKSTHTRLWRQVFGERAVMVNDDKPFLKFTEGGIFLCGSPWSGKHGLDTNITVPLKGICILERGTENRICRIQPQKAAPMVWKQSQPPLDPQNLPQYHCLVEALLEKAAFWHLECTKEPQAAQIAWEAMAGNE